MKLVRTAPFGLALAFALAGCGGSTIGSGGSSATPSNSLRTNATGDTFNYTVAGSYSNTLTGSSNVTTTGTATEAFTSNVYGGQIALQDVLTTNLQLVSGLDTLTDTKQISTSSLLVLGQSDNGSVSTVTGTGFTVPATLGNNTNVSATETLADGTTITLAYQVTGTKSVPTEAGTFACWTLSRTVNYSDGFSSTQTVYFAPTIGAMVQSVVSNTYSNGFSDTLTYSLQSYTLGTAAAPAAKTQ